MDHKTYILEFLEERKVVSGKNLSRNEFKEFIEYLKEQTPWLPEKAKPVFRIKCIVDGVTEIPTCAKEGCCNEVSIKPQQGHERFFDTYIFTEYCSRKCATTSDQTVKKRAETTLERHGVECYIKAPDFKEKATKTNLARYGVEKAHESAIVKERTKKTVRERYGVDYITQTDVFKEKATATNIERYGVAVPSKSEQVKEVARQTCLEKYGVTNQMKNPEVLKRHQESILSKHGVANVSQIPGHKERCQKTNLERYGETHFSKTEECKLRKVEKSVERWGCASPMQSPEVLAKVIQFNRENYGVDYFYQSEAFKEKSRQTMIERYGVDSPQRNPEIRHATLMTTRDRYGVDSFNQSHISSENLDILKNPNQLQEMYETYGVQETASRLGVNATTVYAYLSKHGVELDSRSSGELSVCSYLDELGIEYETGDRKVLGSLELDIVIPSKKIAIEFNGIYWHSTKFRSKDYHLEKTTAAKNVGYRLIHIYEDEWYRSMDAWKLKIASILGVDSREKKHARKLSVRCVTESEHVREFLNANHIQGAATFSFAYGLYDGDDVVAVMTFKKRSETEYELNRYATSCRVVGGFTKIFKKALVDLGEIGVQEIVSFADIGHSDGNMYAVGGWTHACNTKPDYRYVIDGRRVRKQAFRRKQQAKMFKDFDPNKTEMQNMLDRGIYPIYDSGLMKFVYQVANQEEETK